MGKKTSKRANGRQVAGAGGSITGAVRAALVGSGKTLYVVARDTGISWRTVKRFYAGENIRSDHLDVLAGYFGLRVR